MAASLLNTLGQEVTGIVGPVSLCMALTVMLVRVLNPTGASDAHAVYIASAFYAESVDDSAGTKLIGSFVNALIFVLLVGVMTTALFFVFKLGYTRCIYAYMGFAAFSIFFFLTGTILLALLQRARVHLDVLSFSYALLNFAVVGAATLFVYPAPLLMKQGYLVITSVATAFVFTWVPEWTTWLLLLAMAAYDVAAVMSPAGPLRMLVELSEERNEPIPALVYQARAVRSDALDAARVALESGRLHGQVELSPLSSEAATQCHSFASLPEREASEREAMLSSRRGSGRARPPSPAPGLESLEAGRGGRDPAPEGAEGGRRGLPSADGPRHRRSATPPMRSPRREPVHAVGAGTPLSRAQVEEAEAHPSEAGLFSLPEAIKLGLGDLIFYSVLVGRAAMYDWLTVVACYVAIVTGLCCTLIWLAVAQHALPALPFSITLAVVFYFLTRFLLEPVALSLAVNLLAI